MAYIAGKKGTYSSEQVIGTTDDDTIDFAGGVDTVDGGDGTDTLYLFDVKANFNYTILPGITRINGTEKDSITGEWGKYRFDSAVLMNVEKIQFSDGSISLDTSKVIPQLVSGKKGTYSSEQVIGTTGDDIIDFAGGVDTVDGGDGTDTLYLFDVKANFNYTILPGITRINGTEKDSITGESGKYRFDSAVLMNVEKIQFSDGLLDLNTGSFTSPSSTTPTPTNTNHPPTGSVTISGTAQVGQTLSAAVGIFDQDGYGAFSIQWLRNGSPISGEIAWNYVLTQTDIGKNISVKASYVDGLNNPESVTSSATGGVTAAASAGGGDSTQTNSSYVSENLLVNPGAEFGNLTGWSIGGNSKPSVDNGTEDVGINPYNGLYDFIGVTGPSATLTQNVNLINNGFITTGQIDSGNLLANLTFFEQGLNQSEPSDSASVTLTFLSDSNITLSTVSSVEVDSHNGSWQKYSNSFSIPVGTRSIDYTMNFIRHKGSFLDAFIDDNSLTVSVDTPNINNPPTGTLEITGTAQQNQTLSVKSTVADADGLGAFNYQWLSNGAVISGATQATYILAAADVGKNISVKVSYTDLKNTPESVTSGATTAITAVAQTADHAPTGTATINGTAQEGQTINVTNTFADADGLGEMSYQWLSDGNAISGATKSTYTLTSAEVGKTISVRVDVVDELNNSYFAIPTIDSPTTALSPANHKPTGTVTVSGTAEVGQTLTANNTLADADGMGVVSYKWGYTLNGSNYFYAPNATQSTYTLTANDVGKSFYVIAYYTDLKGKYESMWTDDTKFVTASTPTNTNHPPTGNVTISGTAEVGKTLTVNSTTLADADGLGALSYQWLSNNIAIQGETNNSHAISANDVGNSIAVKVSFVDGKGNAENEISQAVIPTPTPIPVVRVVKFTGTAVNDIVNVNNSQSYNYYNGGVGDDVYVISPKLTKSIEISDATGSNKVNLPNGITLTKVVFSGNGVQCTLNSGAIITINSKNSNDLKFVFGNLNQDADLTTPAGQAEFLAATVTKTFAETGTLFGIDTTKLVAGAAPIVSTTVNTTNPVMPMVSATDLTIEIVGIGHNEALIVV
jgi:hypothetical protein